MTLKEMAGLVDSWRSKHGDDTPVYFDCPHCNVSFTPGLLASTCVVVKTPNAEPKAEKGH